MRCIDRKPTPTATAIIRPDGWMASPGGLLRRNTRATCFGGGMPVPNVRLETRDRPGRHQQQSHAAPAAIPRTAQPRIHFSDESHRGHGGHVITGQNKLQSSQFSGNGQIA